MTARSTPTAAAPTAADRRNRTVSVRGLELGAGRAKIIVPLVGADGDALRAQATAACASPARILEWRVDCFAPQADAAEHRERVLAMLPQLRAQLGEERALLVTVRTAAEGGQRELPDGELAALLCALIEAGTAQDEPLVDLVDIEMARGAETVAQVTAAAHARHIPVVGSFHDFHATPPLGEITRILREQRRRGADIPKIAVTPRSPEEVLTLLAASSEIAADGEGPHIAISMGTLGAVSRAAAETFGSAATFAQVGEASAPGQLDVADVARLLELLRP